MKIYSIPATQPTLSNYRALRNNPSEPQKPTSENINFAGWKAMGEQIIKADERTLRDFAASFHKSAVGTLKDVATVTRCGIRVESESSRAYYTLETAVKRLLNYKNECLEEIHSLEKERDLNQGYLNSVKNYELTRLKNVVKNMDDKAEKCYNDYYEYESSESSYSDYSESPYYPYTHYDY